MSRTYRKIPTECFKGFCFRRPKTMNERRQLNGVQTDARLNQIDISPSNRLSRHIPDAWEDLDVAAWSEAFTG